MGLRLILILDLVKICASKLGRSMIYWIIIIIIIIAIILIYWITIIITTIITINGSSIRKIPTLLKCGLRPLTADIIL